MVPVTADASGGPVISRGIIFTRGLVTDEDGNPYFAEFDDNGVVVNVIGVAAPDSELGDAQVLSGASYRSIALSYTSFRLQYGDDIDLDTEVVSIDAFESLNYPPVEVPVAGGEPGETETVPVRKGEPFSSTQSLLILKQDRIIDPRVLGPKGVILFEAPIDLNEASDPSAVGVTDQTRSVLVRDNGTVLLASENNIGYRAAYIRPESDGDVGDPAQDHVSLYTRGDRLWSGVDGALVESGLGGRSASLDGHFTVIDFIPPCPGFYWDYDIPLWAGVYYRNFNPQAPRPYGQTYFRGFNFATCNGYGEVPLGFSLSAINTQLALLGIALTTPNFSFVSKIPVDLAMFTGTGELRNRPDDADPNSTGEDAGNAAGEIVTFGPETTYNMNRQTFEDLGASGNATADLQYDFDADGVADWVSLPGSFGELPADPDGPLYVGIYLGQVGEFGFDELDRPLTEEGEIIEPDLIRLADQLPDFAHRGLLETISHEDLRNTDLYVFRVSTGALVAERVGLFSEGRLASGNYGANGGLLVNDNKLYYRMVIPGPRSGLAIGSSQGLAAWQQSLGVQESFVGFGADSLRPGEAVKIVAVNRATGYIATQETVFQSLVAGRIDVSVPELKFYPPNLRVWAERVYTIDGGLTDGQRRRRQLGAEGSALTTDTYLALYTDWTDADGRPLPEELPGYTGRLSVVADGGSLVPDSSGFSVGSDDFGEQAANSVNFFEVKPGRHLQLIKLQGDVIGTEHFYFHINGEKEYDPADFESDPDNLERPSRFVPLRVSVYDEITTRAAENALAILDPPPDPGGEDELTIDPVFRWPYRPELQFSFYELEIADIERIDEFDQVSGIFDLDIPAVTTDDLSFNVLASLLQNMTSLLELFGPGKELLFSIGGVEILADDSASAMAQFMDLNFLQAIDAEGFITLQLLQNTDSSNILFEWAFEVLTLDVDADIELFETETIFVSADEPTLEIVATLLGYEERDPEMKEARTVEFSVEGAGSVEPTSVTDSDSGMFDTTLTMPTVAGASTVVVARLITDGDVEIRSNRIEVIPGEAAVVSVSTAGTTYAQSGPSIDAVATVLDAHGNPVINGTSVEFELGGAGTLFSHQGITVDGTATATIGGSYSSGAGTLTVSAGNSASGTAGITVEPVTLQFNGLPSTLNPGQQYDFTISATAGGGAAAEGVFVDLSFDGGQFLHSDLRTNSQGDLGVSLVTGRRAGTYRLSARADLNNEQFQSIQIDSSSDIVPQRHFLVSQGATRTPLFGSHKSFTGATRTVTFEPSSVVNFSGTPGQPWQISLGTPYMPNREPLSMFRARFLSYDESGLSVTRSIHAQRSNITPGRTGFSAAFGNGLDSMGDPEAAAIFIDYADRLIPPRPAFAAQVFVDTPGQLLNWGDGALVVNVLGDNSVEAVAVTDQGTLTATSAPVPASTWVPIGVGLDDTGLYVSVDGQAATAAATAAAVVYPAEPPVGNELRNSWVVLGGGFEGRLDLPRLYDLGAPPILQLQSAASGVFDGGGQAQAIIAPDAPLGDQWPGSRIDTVSVAIGVNNSSSYVNLIKADTFSEQAGMLADVFSLTDVSQTDFENAVFSDCPFPASTEVPAKILERASDSVAGDSLSSVIATLGVLGFHEDMQTLQPSIQTIQSYYAQVNQPQMILATADMLGLATKEAMRGDGRLLRVMETSLVVLSELIVDSPNAASMVASAIDSRDDFWIWMRYLSLPGKGWVGPVTPVPRPENVCGTGEDVANDGTPLAFSTRPCRITGDVIATAVDQWFTGAAAGGSDPRAITADIRVLLEALRGSPPEINRLVFDHDPNGDPNTRNPGIAIRTLLKIAIDVIKKNGKNNFIAFVRNGTNSRVGRLEMLTAIAYLGLRDPEVCDAQAGCKALEQQVAEQVRTGIAKWLGALAVSRKGIIADESGPKEAACQISGQGHGAAFEVLLTAMYHSLYDIGGVEYFRVISADNKDHQVPIWIFKKKLRSAEIERVKRRNFGRRMDLVLNGEGVDKRVWVEAKSYRFLPEYLRGTNVNPSKFEQFDPEESSKENKKKFRYLQKQYFSDRFINKGPPSDTDNPIRQYWDAKVVPKLDLPDFGSMGTHEAGGKYIWWWQVWDDTEPRTFVKKRRRGVPPSPSDRIPVTLDKSWARPSDVRVFDIKPKFKALQRFLTNKTATGTEAVWQAMIGTTAANTTFQNDQVGHFETVRPFVLEHAYARSLLDSGSSLDPGQIIETLTQQLLPPEYRDWLKGDLSPEQLEQLQEVVDAKLNELLGVLGDLLAALDRITPEWYKKLEDEVSEFVDGLAGEELTELIGEISLPGAGFCGSGD